MDIINKNLIAREENVSIKDLTTKPSSRRQQQEKSHAQSQSVLSESNVASIGILNIVPKSYRYFPFDSLTALLQRVYLTNTMFA